MDKNPRVNLPKPPAGGWGSVEGIVHIYGESWATPAALETLARLNKPGGSMCTSCAWPKPVNYHPFEFCENGAKAILWDTTSARCTPNFWDRHTVTELRGWTDHALEKTGRLTAPLRYDAAQDRYVEVSWDEAFADMGKILRALPRQQAVFYASGHAGLEASYLYALLARVYGNNNLPQSSNMCHETTSVGLKRVIGSPVGTVIWEDLAEADCFFFFGQNPGVNSPRFLHPLKDAKKRGAKVITFNPVREQGLVAFVDPSSAADMLTGRETQISDQYHQLRAGSDIAALTGLCKAVLEADVAQGGTVIDHAFLAEHTRDAEAFFDFLRNTSWAAICAETGLTEEALRSAAAVYMSSERVIGVYGMGLTQQVHGSTNVGMLVNFLLLRGNIGRPGAGCCPVRGHSNVQGQRTVGVAEKAALVPMDKLRALFDFEPPQEDGLHIVEVGEALLRGEVAATISLGGNLLRAMPDIARLEEVWPQQALTVTVSTKLNRSHLYPGKSSYILPCLSRVEIDAQATGNQTVTIEDSFSMIHPSVGHREPASPKLRSELAIVAGIAKATLDAHPKLRWDDWQADYGLVRELIAATYPEDFHDFNARIQQPGGFWRVNAARERVWKTPSGKAEFTVPERLNALNFDDAPGRYRLITLRSNDQFNTTVYGYSDRFRGIEGTRDVLLMHGDDIAAAGLQAGQRVTLLSDAADGIERRVTGLEVVAYEIPRGTVAGYYPELNPLIPISQHDQLSKTPASKGIAVRVAS